MIKNVITYLEQAATDFPEKIGFCDEVESCTFNEMNLRAKRIGTQIIQGLGGRRNKPIAVYMDKSVASLSVFFGIVYSGNFYVPIDVKSPTERIKKIFATLKPEIIYTQEKYLETVRSIWQNHLIMLESENVAIDEVWIQKSVKKQLDVDPLYVLFTSGSTGIPKGVVVSHKSVIDYVEWLRDFFKFNEDIVLGNQAPFYFDNSVFDIYSTIRNAATLYIIPERLFAFPQKLMEYIQEKGINTIFWVPSALIGVANANILKVGMNTYLKKVLFCGEVMPNKQLNIWRGAIPNALYANLYGPTEITDVCSCYVVERTFRDEESLPIGYACNNMEIFLLNEQDKLCQGQEIGEICVRGTGLAHGYYANTVATGKVFVQNPLNSEWPDLIYRTGDLAYYNTYGELDYVGRKDHQIKHNGYRIELGEIEQAASCLEGIERACALYDEQTNKILLFCMAEDVQEKIVYMALKNKIPSYMLPSKIIIVKKFELNANGKIDRKQLKKYYKGEI
ncbi:MAG: amino acid adenylation domain-containing protein [Lachnospiraceae bacterium]|nr:amino acid adenylation domain-containing protein [Lachnospiraceae bacterium]